jgi:alpha-glucosidase
MAYTLRPLRGGFDWPTISGLLQEIADAGTDGWPCWSFSNHDVERAVSRWNPSPGSAPEPAFTRLLMALLLSLRGSICLYQGEELGLTEADLQESDLRDPFGIAYWPEFRGRDGSRTPMPWHADAVHGGFSTAAAGWLPMPDGHRVMAVDAQEADQASLLHAFRRFLHWRRGVPALLHGALHPLPLPEPLIGFVRDHDGQRVQVVVNLSAAPVSMNLVLAGACRVMTGSGFEDCLRDDGLLAPFGVVFAEFAAAEAALPMVEA